MPPINDHIASLIIKHLQETITADEAQTLEQWIDASDDNRSKFNRLTNGETLSEDLMAHGLSDQQIQDQVYTQLPEVKDALTVIPKTNWMRYASLAAAVLVIAFASIWLLRPKQTPVINESEKQVPVAANIPPGGNKATLTLADGTVIDLDKAGTGTIATEGKTKVNKKEDGQLEYKSAIGNRQSAIAYNVLATPRGGQYQLLLPDGSKVWLNAASSIRYPTEFDEKERVVEIEGEAYLEVASFVSKVKKRPFIVKTNKLEIEVLGTNFNINAYSDEEAVLTTLLEGKVRVHYNTINEDIFLQRGQQASLDKNKQQLSKLNNPDVDGAVAWRYGYFQFNGADVKAVLRQILRWYNDVSVEYQGEIPRRTFGGKISRQNNLSQVLEILESNGVHFRIEGRKIIVSL
jgi:transmembrane sensor